VFKELKEGEETAQSSNIFQPH